MSPSVPSNSLSQANVRQTVEGFNSEFFLISCHMRETKFSFEAVSMRLRCHRVKKWVVDTAIFTSCSSVRSIMLAIWLVQNEKPFVRFTDFFLFFAAFVFSPASSKEDFYCINYGESKPDEMLHSKLFFILSFDELWNRCRKLCVV